MKPETAKCYDCAEWCGRCRKGRKNKIASDVACDCFRERDAVLAFITDCFDTIIEVCAIGDKTLKERGFE